MGFFDSIRAAFRGFAGDDLPPGTVRSEIGRIIPAAGFDWVTAAPGDFRVRWCPGKPLADSKLVAGDQPGQVRPDHGYEWAHPDDPRSSEVRWNPGKPHGEAPHVIAAATEGKWATEPGWRWLTREPGDLRVVRDDGHATGAAPGQRGTERQQRIRDLATLGLDELAAGEAIEAAFRRLVMIHHPDHFHGRGAPAQEAAEQAFRMLRGAYERLTRAQGGQR